MSSVTFIDESLPGARTSVGTADFPATTVTARDIIARRVAQDVAAINANSVLGARRSLVVPTAFEKQLNGDVRPAQHSQPLDEEKIRQAAFDAFSGNGFFVIVDDAQLTSLDQATEIALESEVVFIKLVPLVGG